MYATVVYYGAEKVWAWIRQAKAEGCSHQTGLGDDVLTIVEKFSDLKPLAEIIHNTFGMDISVDGVKTAVGVDFLQELFIDGHVVYPVARTAESALYSERAKGLGWAE